MNKPKDPRSYVAPEVETIRMEMTSALLDNSVFDSDDDFEPLDRHDGIW